MYVDKTEIIHRLVETGTYYFLSRPRRFGKSLLVDTIEELFKGSRELFRGLWVEDHWDWSVAHPVIHLNIAELPYKEIGLSEALKIELERIAGQLGVELHAGTLSGMFRELIEKASVNRELVILIDEYDKALIDYLDDTKQLETNRSVMKDFYSVLKGRDEQIRFLLLTGVSRFSKVSIFSDLNNLEDISVGRSFNNLVGITQAELERDFAWELETYPEVFGVSEAELREQVRARYNGYSWGGEDTLYNPFSLLSFMKQREFRNFWFATGSPTFLVKGIQARGDYDFERVTSTEGTLASFEPDNLLSVPLLFQTGYLTIKSYHPVTRMYELGYPNLEVKDSLLDNLLSAYRGVYPDNSAAETGALLLAVQAGDVPGIVAALNAVIAGIPYDYWNADSESVFTIIAVLTFRKIGVDVHTEVHSARGRCDVLVETADFLYVLELKLDGTAEEALEQILTKGYLQPYETDIRRKIAIGLSFSSSERRVAEYMEKVVE